MPSPRSTRRQRGGHGIHHIRSMAVLNRMVRAAGLREGQGVIELGAGPGSLTSQLFATGAKVTAVERDPDFVKALKRRFRNCSTVTVVAMDIHEFRLPRTVQVVANLPFSTSEAVIASLLDPARRPHAGAELIVQKEFGFRLVGPPRSAQSAWRTARYEIELRGVIGRRAFAPAPKVDAAHISVRPRAMTRTAECMLRQTIDYAYGPTCPTAGSVARAVFGRRRGPRILAELNGHSMVSAREVAPGEWAELSIQADRH